MLLDGTQHPTSPSLLSMLVLAEPQGCLGVREGQTGEMLRLVAAGCLFRPGCPGALSGSLHADEAFQFGLRFLGFLG